MFLIFLSRGLRKPAAQLRRHGIDEKVLFFQRLGQRTTGAGVLVPDVRIRNTFRDDFQAAKRSFIIGQDVYERLTAVLSERFDDASGEHRLGGIYPVARQHFEKAGKEIERAVVRTIYERFNGITWYIQKMLRRREAFALWR